MHLGFFRAAKLGSWRASQYRETVRGGPGNTRLSTGLLPWVSLWTADGERVTATLTDFMPLWLGPCSFCKRI